MNNNQETVKVNENVVNVNETETKKKMSGWKKAALWALGIIGAGTAAILLDNKYNGGKARKAVISGAKSLGSKKDTTVTVETTKVENQGGQQYRQQNDRRDYRPRNNYNGGQNYQKPATENCGN